MKTSNKLLILLLVLVFSLPLVLMMSFKAAIKNEHYIVKNSNGYDNVPAGALQPFKFIKIEGSIRNEMLKCNIKYGETNRYKWINYSSEQHGDSSRLISYKGDTLVIHYQPKIETINGQESYWAGAELELVLNREVPVIAEGAVITVNTLNGGYTKALEFDLSKNAELNIVTVLDHRPDISDSVTESNRILIPSYTIKSDNSKVNIDAHIRLSKLNLAAKNNSTLSIGKEVLIDSVNAGIAPETIVSAPYKFVGSFKPVTIP